MASRFFDKRGNKVVPEADNGGELTPGKVLFKFEKSSKALRRFRQDYLINKAFLAGEQWVYWDNPTNRIRNYPREPDRVRATVNRLWPISRHIISRLLSRDLTFEVPPMDTDDATIRGADVAEAIIEDLQREHDWEHIREEAAWNAWLGGTSIVAVDWDPSRGETIGTLPSGKSFGTGEVIETSLSILDVAWEPGTKDAERSLWWIRAQALPPAEVQERYRLENLPPADVQTHDAYLSRTSVVEDRHDDVEELTLVLTYYERPNSIRKNGAVATVVNNEFVDDGPKDWPFPFKDRLNFVTIRETVIPGRAAGDTVFTAAVPVQTAFNASWSNIIEHLKLAGNALLMVPEGSLENVDEISDLPGGILTYMPGEGEPQWLSPAQLPQWIIEEPQILSSQMDDVLGLHDVSRGNAPANIESGVGLAVLVEQDTTPIGHLTKEMAHAFERLATMALKIYEKNVKETRTARVKVPGRIPEIVRWTGKALSGQTVARIPIDAVMPRSRTAMMAFAREMWDRQIISDPEIFARMADLPEQEDLLEAMNPDMARAQRENHLMTMGHIPLPELFDEHGVHIKRHNLLRKSARYETLSNDKREVIDLHVAAHETLAAQQAGEQVAKSQVNPALAAIPTANEAAPLPPEVAAAGAEAGVGGVTDPSIAGPPAQPTTEAELASVEEESAQQPLPF